MRFVPACSGHEEIPTSNRRGFKQEGLFVRGVLFLEAAGQERFGVDGLSLFIMISNVLRNKSSFIYRVKDKDKNRTSMSSSVRCCQGSIDHIAVIPAPITERQPGSSALRWELGG